MAKAAPFVTSVIACSDLGLAAHAVTNRDVRAMLLAASFGAEPTEQLREEAARRHVKYLITVMEQRGQSQDWHALKMVTHGVILLDSLTSESLTGVLRLLAIDQTVLPAKSDGLSNKQIASRISISEHGVKKHVTNVRAKLNCPNRTQAVSFALQAGILPHTGQLPQPG